MNHPAYGSGNIILTISESSRPVTRATDGENLISHIDVLIFNENESCDYHERVDYKSEDNPGNSDRNGTIVLGKARETFDDKAKYYVYLIANSTAPEGVFEAFKPEGDDAEPKTLNDLRAMVQADEAVHLTGTSATGDGPDYFLMDGAAFLKGGTEITPPAKPQPVVLYDSESTSTNTELQVNLRRAAAKIVVTINRGEAEDEATDPRITFDNSQAATAAGYYIQNMPYSTSLLAESPIEDPDIDNTSGRKTAGEYFSWSQDVITVTGYTYAHDWNQRPLGENVSMVVNIPMYYDDPAVEGDEKTLLANNYYQIPVSKQKVLDRNTCYYVDVTVSVKGGQDPASAITLTNIKYNVYDWIETGVSVGAPEEYAPNYLSVNKELVQMYNVETDNTLEFASSSQVTVEVENYYFVDKNGVEVWRYDENGNSIEANEDKFPAGEATGEEEKEVTVNITTPNYWTHLQDSGYGYSKESWLESNNIPIEFWPAIKALGNSASYSYKTMQIVTIYKDAISVTWEDKLNGKITVNSPLPENNTIRYIILKVTNTDGSTPKYVTVEQYPLEYIAPIEAWYSYRSDFYSGTDASKVTTYQTKNAGYVYTTYYNDKWNHNHSTQGYYDNPFFRSKAYDAKNTGEAKAIYYYNWQSTLNGHANLSGNVWDYDAGNPRIYHVRITASSDDYTLGIPNLEEKTIGGVKLMVTDDADANALLVSPSFMIASQLGAVTSTGLTLDVAASHCAQYVEAYKVLDANGNEVIENGMVKTVDLDDWRLPTSAELYIINRFQRTRGSAIDDVLKGSNYYSASGIVNIEGQDLSKYDNIKTATGDNPEFSYSGGTAIRCIRDAY